MVAAINSKNSIEFLGLRIVQQSLALPATALVSGDGKVWEHSTEWEHSADGRGHETKT